MPMTFATTLMNVLVLMMPAAYAMVLVRFMNVDVRTFQLGIAIVREMLSMSVAFVEG